MTSPPEPLVRMPFTTIALMVLLRFGSAEQKGFRALDEKYLSTTSPKILVQIQNDFTELFFMMASTKIAQKDFTWQNKGATRGLDKKSL